MWPLYRFNSNAEYYFILKIFPSSHGE